MWVTNSLETRSFKIFSIYEFLFAVKSLCIEERTKTEPVDFEPLADKGKKKP